MQIATNFTSEPPSRLTLECNFRAPKRKKKENRAHDISIIQSISTYNLIGIPLLSSDCIFSPLASEGEREQVKINSLTSQESNSLSHIEINEAPWTIISQ